MRLALDEADRVPVADVFILPLRLDNCEIPASLRRWHIVDCFAPEGCHSLLKAVKLGLHEPYIQRSEVVDRLQRQFDLYGHRTSEGDPFELHLTSSLVTIDLLDSGGHEAIHTRNSTFVSMRDGVNGYTEHMSADGSAVDFTISPGSLENIRKEGGDLFLRRNFGRVLKRGDTITQILRHRLIDAFVDNPEYWSIRIVIPTTQFTLQVNFPPERPYRSFEGFHRVTAHENFCEVQPIEIANTNGAKALTWTIPSPQVKDVYKLTWSW